MSAGLVSHIGLEELRRAGQGSAHLPQNNTDNSRGVRYLLLLLPFETAAGLNSSALLRPA